MAMTTMERAILTVLEQGQIRVNIGQSARKELARRVYEYMNEELGWGELSSIEQTIGRLVREKQWITEGGHWAGRDWNARHRITISRLGGEVLAYDRSDEPGPNPEAEAEELTYTQIVAGREAGEPVKPPEVTPGAIDANAVAQALLKAVLHQLEDQTAATELLWEAASAEPTPEIDDAVKEQARTLAQLRREYAQNEADYERRIEQLKGQVRDLQGRLGEQERVAANANRLLAEERARTTANELGHGGNGLSPEDRQKLHDFSDKLMRQSRRPLVEET